ncbi:agmatine deiminase family protein [Candidatus Uhrbacteria bacterium]|nr:agmatine deiminase family protein [Candidatus Uhrbacteria bacterium]
MNPPIEQGFQMPAEWARHEGTWLAWPYDDTTFPERVENVQKIFSHMVAALSTSEKIFLIVLDEAMKKMAEHMLQSSGAQMDAVYFYKVPFADVWTRDYGPLTITNKEDNKRAWTKWVYNAYGKSHDPYYAPLLADNEVFNIIALEGQKFEPGIVLEGGAIEVNGEGVCLTCEQTLLNPNRNPILFREDMKKYLHDFLGVKKTIWLKEGLVNDHTDGHIEELARFVSPDTIVCAYEDDPSDENYEILQKNYEVIKQATDLNGNPFRIITLPMPHVNYDDGTKAPVSYCNFYIANTVVLAALFQDPNDQEALSILQSCFPDKKVIGLDCSDIIYGGGAIHCMTQQVPE